MEDSIRNYHSQSQYYDEAFNFLLEHTDEKQKSIAWLKEVVKQLPSRRLFIDAGAGDGILTQALAPDFSHTIALEPNSKLRRKLRENCPGIDIQPHSIMDADIPSLQADFILCSHVLYYVEQSRWLAYMDRLATWLAPEGTLVLILQHHASDGMQMQTHFFGAHYNLSAAAQSFKAQQGEKYRVDIEIMPLDIVTPDLSSAYRIAEFMLNLLPVTNLPTRREVESYIQRFFKPETNVYRLSSDQVLVKIHTIPKNEGRR